jgi:hypothetical protein
MADLSLEYWQQQAEAARRVADIMEDPLGKRAMLDVAATCEQLASNPRLARAVRIWPEPTEAECLEEPAPWRRGAR